MRLTAQRLLRNQRIRACRTRVYLVVDKMQQFHHVHIAYRDPIVKRFASAAVVQLRLAVFRKACKLEGIHYFNLIGAIEYRRHYLPAERLGRIPEMCLENLPDIHPRRHPERVQHYLERRTIRQERHILFRQYPGNNTFVPVSSRHLVSDRYLPLLSDIDPHKFIDSWRQFIAVLTRKYLHIYDDALFAVWHAQRRIAHFPGFLSEYRSQEPFFGC